MMCRVLNVSRSGYYAWSERGESARVIRDRELLRRVRQVHLASRGVYGARKIHRELVAAGDSCGRHKVAKLMHEAGLNVNAD
jgi:putative transposase